jgi:hypothetical protein
LEEFFGSGLFVEGLKLGTLLREADPPEAPQFLGHGVLNELATARKLPTLDEPVDLPESFGVQRDGDLGAAHEAMVSPTVTPDNARRPRHVLIVSLGDINLLL